MFRQHWGSDRCERAGQISGKHSQDLLRAFPGWHVEVKRYANIGAFRFADQCLEDSDGDPKHIVMMREDRHQWYIMLPFLSAREFAEDLIEHLGGQVAWPE